MSNTDNPFEPGQFKAIVDAYIGTGVTLAAAMIAALSPPARAEFDRLMALGWRKACETTITEDTAGVMLSANNGVERRFFSEIAEDVGNLN